MTIQRIEYGSLADSELINSNFTELQTEISSVGSSISTLQSNISSVNSTLNSNINTLETSLTETIEGVQSDLEDAIEEVSSRSYIPDYSHGVSINSGHTCTADGLIIAHQELGHPTSAMLAVNGYQVANAWYSWRGDYSGIIRPVTLFVAKNDVITFTNSSVKFYPFRGA